MSALRVIFPFLLVWSAGCDRGAGQPEAIAALSVATAARPTGVAPAPDEHAHSHDTPDHVDPAPASSATGSGSGSPDVVYTCPMHPDVKSKEPGRCPECGMNLVPKKP
jgi:hypothetical protein